MFKSAGTKLSLETSVADLHQKNADPGLQKNADPDPDPGKAKLDQNL